jgi:hypothetical protein
MDKIGELQSLRQSGHIHRHHGGGMSTSTSVRRPSSTFLLSFRPYILVTASHLLQVLGKYQVFARIETGVRLGAEINKRNVERLHTQSRRVAILP